LFSVFIDEFYNVSGVSALALPTLIDPVAWKVGLPTHYDPENAVTMRIYMALKTDQEQPECPTFGLVPLRLRNGTTLEFYGPEQVYITLEYPALSGGFEPDDEMLGLFIDLPLNTAEGLNLPDDLEAGDLLAFGMEWAGVDCAALGDVFMLLGVEFFESAPDETSLQGATVSATLPDCVCGGDE
jgi:hypothetical protein